MADVKISEITTTLTAPKDSDLLEASRDDGGGTWTTAKARLLDLRSWLAGFFAPSSHVGAGSTSEHPSAIPNGDAGFLTGIDKAKLDGVQDFANAYVHPNHTGEVTSIGDGGQTIEPGVITNTKMANDAIATANIQNLAVENAKLAANAVTNSKVADNAIGNVELDDMPANTIKLRVTTAGDPTDSTIEALADHPTPLAGDLLFGQKPGGDLVKIDVGNLPTTPVIAHILYTFRSSTDTGSNPGTGSMRLNAGTFAATTQMAFNDVDETGLNIRALLLEATSGEDVIVRDAVESDRAAHYTVSADAIAQTGFVQINVTYVSEGTGGFLRNNRSTAVFYERTGGGVGGGDVTGPASAVDGNLASFNGTSGKAIQDSNLSSSNIPILVGGNQWTNGQTINGWLALGAGTNLTISVGDSNHQVASAATELTLDVDLVDRGWTSLLIENDVNVITAGILVAGDFPTGANKLAAVGTNGADKYLVWQGALA